MKSFPLILPSKGYSPRVPMEESSGSLLVVALCHRVYHIRKGCAKIVF
ncbi:hypothetical protein HMPREF1990_00644 [Porphyromonas gingivalis W4087]|nr:hypothetical protein HMPREF1989_01259 [Porphyromonas gingivalis F0566]ERJ90242.1 hypothetical protein HMPREF1990_00644 [Porphyromonas gingivalis W4087]